MDIIRQEVVITEHLIASLAANKDVLAAVPGLKHLANRSNRGQRGGCCGRKSKNKLLGSKGKQLIAGLSGTALKRLKGALNAATIVVYLPTKSGQPKKVVK